MMQVLPGNSKYSHFVLLIFTMISLTETFAGILMIFCYTQDYIPAS